MCLEKMAGFARRQLQTTIKCPVCQTSFQIPEGDTFNNLPTSFHLNRLVDVLALREGRTQAQKCSSCDENNTATCYCFVCQNFLCTASFDAHQRLKTTRGHRNVLIDKLQAQDVEELINRPVMCSQLAPCKGIQASRGFRIPTVGFRIPCLWIPDSKLSVIPDSKVLNSGCHSYFKGQYFFKLYEVVYLN